MSENINLTQEQIDEIKEVMSKFAEAVAEFLEIIVEKWLEFLAVIRRMFEPFFRKIEEIHDSILRLILFKKLRKWHIPDWIAFRIAKHIPRRLLLR